MSIEIRLPALSPTMVEADLVQWHVTEGDTVSAGDIIAEIETDKAAADVQAPQAGTVARILVPEGTEGVEVDTVIALFEPAAGSGTSCAAQRAPAGSKPESIQLPEPVGAAPDSSPQTMAHAETSVLAPDSRPGSFEPVNASPLALRMAAQLGLDLTQVPGSGPNDRITKADVEAAITGKPPLPERELATGRTSKSVVTPKSTGTSKSVSPPSQGGARGGPVSPPSQGGARGGLVSPPSQGGARGGEPAFELKPLSKMRKAIARRLSHSKQTVPHFYMTVDCNLDQVVAFRNRFNDQLRGEFKLSLGDVIIKAAAAALGKVPAANASWSDQGIKLYRSVDISIAVAVDGGLITPIIRNAESKGLRAISMETKALAAAARQGKLRPEQYQGGTFTISNLGMYGIKQFQAIVDPPQACVLAVGMAEERPVVRNGTVEVSTLMSCTLSADHRVLDGALAAEFLCAFKQYIEEPVTMLIEPS